MAHTVAKRFETCWALHARSMWPGRPVELEELSGIGADLREAYRVASGENAGPAARRAAWAKAERATTQLLALLSQFETVKSVVEATSARLGFAPTPLLPFDRNEKLRERMKRG